MIMKKARITTVACALAISLCGVSSSLGVESGAVAVDALLVRPVCLVSTVIGSALFVVCLPVAAISKSIKPSARALVVRPARATFARPLGDLEELAAYYED